MKSRLLKWLNAPGLVFISLILMTLQSTLFTQAPLSYLKPDSIVLILLWISMRRSFYEGGTLALVLGYCMELNSSAPRGLFLANAMFLFLIAHFLHRNFHILNKKVLMVVGGSFSALSHGFTLLIMFILNKGENEWMNTIAILIPSAIVHALLAPTFFHYLHRFDFWTLKNPHAEHQHDQEFFLDEEFI